MSQATFAIHQVVSDLNLPSETFYPTDLLTVEIAIMFRTVTVFAIGRAAKGRVFGLAFTRTSSEKETPILVRRLQAGVWEPIGETEEWVTTWIKKNPGAIKDGRERVADLLVSE